MKNQASLRRPSLFLCAASVGIALSGCATSTSTSKATDAPSTNSVEAGAKKTGVFNTIERVAAPISEAAKAIASAEDRTEADKKDDGRRHPGELLTFAGLAPGMRVADLGAGGGFTTELLVRAVAPDGVVYAQNNARTLEKFVSKSWPERLLREVNKDVVRVDREFSDPLPPEAKNLDAVTIIFSYHDVVAGEYDRTLMNAAVFEALKPGGVYIIADHNAPPTSGLEAANDLHRLRAKFIHDEVEAAGFEFVAESHFLRDPKDDLSKVSYKVGFNTDRYVLKFRRPE